MNKSNLLFIGLDTGKEHSEVAYSGASWEDKLTLSSRIKTTKQAIQKLVRQFQSKYPSATLHFVYEAGPCGYWIYRLLTQMGHPCYVVAPSLVPKKPGAKIKNDKRDALMLCQLLKTGDIDPIYVPEPEDEAVRDLSRLDLRFCPVDVFKQLQTLLHPLVFMHSNQNCNAAPPLVQHHWSMGIVNLLYKGCYAHPEIGQRANIFV